MANALALSRLIDFQLELFELISYAFKYLNKLGKNNINREVLTRLNMLRKIGQVLKEIT